MKKTVFRVIISVLTFTTLTACSEPDQAELNEMSTIKKIGYVEFDGQQAKISILEDQVHGCLYLFYTESTRAGISPYYDENGKVKGCKGEENQKIMNNKGEMNDENVESRSYE